MVLSVFPPLGEVFPLCRREPTRFFSAFSQGIELEIKANCVISDRLKKWCKLGSNFRTKVSIVTVMVRSGESRNKLKLDALRNGEMRCLSLGTARTLFREAGIR